MEALTRCCRVSSDVLLNEATPVSSPRQAEAAAHLHSHSRLYAGDTERSDVMVTPETPNTHSAISDEMPCSRGGSC